MGIGTALESRRSWTGVMERAHSMRTQAAEGITLTSIYLRTPSKKTNIELVCVKLAYPPMHHLYEPGKLRDPGRDASPGG